METIAIQEIDTRYEGFRIKDTRRERMIYMSIMEKGILEPLYVIKEPDSYPILLDGFKRLRGAKQCSIELLPITVLEHNKVPGIIKFLRLSANQGLTQIEQANLVDELHQQNGLSVHEIALRLERSPVWVSLRLGILKEMSNMVREKIMNGKFPFRNYLYTLKHFTRVGISPKHEIEKFIDKVSGKGLSTRDIDMLAQGYFKGPDKLKEQIQQGNIDWTLQQLKQQAKENELPHDGLDDLESKMLSQLNWAFVCMTRLTHMLHDTRFESKAFFIKGGKIVKKILSVNDGFISSLEAFYDKAG